MSNKRLRKVFQVNNLKTKITKGKIHIFIECKLTVYSVLGKYLKNCDSIKDSDCLKKVFS